MFSPGTKKKSNYTSRKQPPPAPVSFGSPVTPAPENRKPVSDNVVPDRPSTGTPAPWASSRLSVLARLSAPCKWNFGQKSEGCGHGCSGKIEAYDVVTSFLNTGFRRVST
ncbi:hypothetical protein Tco_1454149 [Tanacetum coccineum]